MSDNLPVAVDPAKVGAIVEAVIVRGDLENLTPQQRTTYYNEVCTSMGLNPLTRPLDFIKLNGKLTLYALKNATDQLRRIYGVSISDVTQEREGDLLIVTAKARDATGRTDVSKGALVLKGLQGENLANAIMKCETKAKRRVTLSICGMGFLDETEVETISNAHAVRLPKKDARKLYGDLEREVDEAEDVDDWLIKNEGRLQVLPADWENIIRLRIDEKRARPAPVEEPTELWTDGEEPPEWSSKWDALGPVKQAGILCNEQGFRAFLTDEMAIPVDGPENAATLVRNICGHIKSRAELATNQAAAAEWRKLVAEYRAWQRADEPDAPHRAPTGAYGGEAGPERAPGDPPGAAGAREVHIPAWDEYAERWSAILEEAADAKQLADLWNSDVHKKLRREIEWPEGQVNVLTSLVRAAIDGLKAKAAEAGA